MKGIFVILDGVADTPNSQLQGKTPLEFAKTPNLDALAKKSSLDYCYTVKEGIIPQSSAAVVSLFGFDPETAPRGQLESIGAGIKLKRGDLAFRINFATIDDLQNRNLLDRRAGRTLTTKEAKILAKAINQEVKLPYKFEFHATLQHRAVLIFRGGFSDNISAIDPDYGSGTAKLNAEQKVPYAYPLDEEEDSKLSADLINNFVRQAHEILDKHPLNAKRVKRGLYSANFLLCRDAGSENIKFPKLKGKWMALGYNHLEIGISLTAKMDLYKFKYPKMKGIDVYANLFAGLKKAIKNANKMIKRNWKKYDYFYIHIKETDLPGHDNKPVEKVKMIEMLDEKMFSYIKQIVERTNTKLLITADHTTSCKHKAHTADPVPVLFYKTSNKEKEKRFTEKEGMEGRKILGRKLLEKTLFSD